MEIGILNFFTPRLPNEGVGILLRESRMLMGIGWKGVEEVADVASDYFMNIFKVGTCERMEECLNTVHRG